MIHEVLHWKEDIDSLVIYYCERSEPVSWCCSASAGDSFVASLLAMTRTRVQARSGICKPIDLRHVSTLVRNLGTTDLGTRSVRVLLPIALNGLINPNLSGADTFPVRSRFPSVPVSCEYLICEKKWSVEILP